MARTNSAKVAGVLVDSSKHADGAGDYDGATDLTPYIAAANAVISRLNTLAGSGVISSTELELIERWLAADYYTIMDPIYVSKSTSGASASFQQRSYRQVAIELDPTGLLNAVLNKQRAGGFWAGRAQDQYAEENDPG